MLMRLQLAVEDPRARKRLQRLLADEDVHLQVAGTRNLKWHALVRRTADMLLVSHALIPQPPEQYIAQVGDLPGSPGIVVLTDRDEVDQHAEYTAAGAAAVLNIELPDQLLREALASAINLKTELLTSAVAVRRAVARPRLSDFVTASPSMQACLQTVRQVAGSDAPLLILGETGVGKERLARAIHSSSRRGEGPFISVNCGAIPEHLIESELFGHEEGAFTGATRARRGCFEMAHRGTIFLDEIGDMPAHLQVKLLHVLQDFEIRPVGGERTIPIDVRIMAATNRDILTEVAEKKFRRDLYYRLSVVTLELPPLRERVEDIPTLAASFVEDLGKRVGRKVTSIHPDAMMALSNYGWPGNVRELINVVERAILLSNGPAITRQELPDEIRAAGTAGFEPAAMPVVADPPGFRLEEWEGLTLKKVRQTVVERCERTYLARLLERTGGRVGKTAALAGMEPRSLYEKMRRYGLKKENFKHLA